MDDDQRNSEVSVPDPQTDREFVEQFERLLQHIEEIVREYPPELREALRDEARVALRLELQERWEALARSADQPPESPR